MNRFAFVADFIKFVVLFSHFKSKGTKSMSNLIAILFSIVDKVAFLPRFFEQERTKYIYNGCHDWMNVMALKKWLDRFIDIWESEILYSRLYRSLLLAILCLALVYTMCVSVFFFQSKLLFFILLHHFHFLCQQLNLIVYIVVGELCTKVGSIETIHTHTHKAQWKSLK